MIMTETYQEYAYSEYFRTALPAHWNIKKLSLIADQTRNGFVDGPFGSDLKSNEYQDSGVPLIQLNNIRDGQHVLRNMKFITQEKKQQLSRHIALPQDVVIAKMADPVARAAIVEKVYNEYVIVADCVKLSPDLSKVDLAFLVWAINSDAVRINAELASTGTTRIRINLAELKKLKIPYPSIIEQQQIANFLDHETAKIDTLIDKQQQLIKLLKEKRQAVISHAVTKGLNPNAPMKDSGVEWLGEVPEHWSVVPIKRICEIKDGTHDTPKYVDASDEAFPLITSKDFIGESISFDNVKYISKENHSEIIKRSNTEPGDVLMSMIGGNIGKALIVTTFTQFSIKNVALFKTLGNEVLAKYILFYLQSGILDIQVSLLSRGGAQGFLSLGDIRNIVFFKIPESELEAIVSNINKQTESFDKVIQKTEAALKIIKERRTALISAAVTGKIDVRNFKAGDTHVA